MDAPDEHNEHNERIGNDLREIIQLCATDDIFYAQTFFKNTVRQESPDFHRQMWDAIEGPSRYVSFMVFRDGAKTTLCRLCLSKRVAFALSRTIVIIGKSETHATRTVEWLMRRVEHNHQWANTFGLRRGVKWTPIECEIYHGVDEIPIRVIAMGITGSTRGINVEDYRPDFIYLDDVCDEENTATLEQRTKINNLIFGALQNSLAPESEAPHAKMVMSQTPLNAEDAIHITKRDPTWSCQVFGVFDDAGQSRWPARFPTDVLLRDKEAYIARGQLSLWMREKECKIVSSELSVFNESLLNYYDILPERRELITFIGIDPTPPPSDREIAQAFKRKDYEVLAVVGLYRYKRKRKFFLCATVKNRGHEPDWTIAQFFELVQAWRPLRGRVETVNYQRTLKWLLSRAMTTHRIYLPIDDHTPDKRKKHQRIIDVIGTLISRGELYVHKSQTDFLEQFLGYPNVVHDDVLDAVSIALLAAMEFAGAGLLASDDMDDADDDFDDEMYGMNDKDVKPLPIRGCP